MFTSAMHLVLTPDDRRTLEQLLLESLPTMRVKKQNLHEENVEVPLRATFFFVFFFGELS
jgi:hypothetical protein